jgi:hypothetical protein
MAASTEWVVTFRRDADGERVTIAYRSPALMAYGLQQHTKGTGWVAAEVVQRDCEAPGGA